MHQGPVPMPDLLPRSESLALSSKARAQERTRRQWARIPRIPWARISGAISLGRVGRLAIGGHTTGYASRMDAAQTHAPRERHLGWLPRQIGSGCAERNGGSGRSAGRAVSGERGRWVQGRSTRAAPRAATESTRPQLLHALRSAAACDCRRLLADRARESVRRDEFYRMSPWGREGHPPPCRHRLQLGL